MTSTRRFAARAVALWTLAVARTASGHDPLEATTTARVEADGLQLSITLGSRRAFRACGRAPFEACARRLYVVASAGDVLTPRSTRAVLQADGDLDLTVSYPRARAGALRLTAVHLQQNPDEMAGATVTVLAGDRALRRQVLDADNASIEVQLAPDAATRLTRASVWATSIIAAIGLIAAVVLRVRRSGGNRRTMRQAVVAQRD